MPGLRATAISSSAIDETSQIASQTASASDGAGTLPANQFPSAVASSSTLTASSAPPGYGLFPTSALLPLQFLLAACPEPNAFLAVQSLSIRLLRALDPLRRLWRSG